MRSCVAGSTESSVEKIEQLRNGGQALLTREHAGTREVAGRAFANLLGGIVGQNGRRASMDSAVPSMASPSTAQKRVC